MKTKRTKTILSLLAVCTAFSAMPLSGNFASAAQMPAENQIVPFSSYYKSGELDLYKESGRIEVNVVTSAFCIVDHI